MDYYKYNGLRLTTSRDHWLQWLGILPFTLTDIYYAILKFYYRSDSEFLF